MRSSFNIVLLVVLATLAACDGKRTPKPQAAQEAPASPDALCKEHGVLEAVCTKCNPALVPVFRAKHDWCEEHGFPESFCPICHPERGGRPAADVSTDAADGPADGTKVRFKTKDTARLAGLQLAKAVEQTVERHIGVTARIVYDAAHVAQINPRMAGVVRAIRVDIGSAVRPGAPLAVIESADVGEEQSRLQAARTQLDVAEANFTRVQALRSDGITPERELLAARREQEDARSRVRAGQASLRMVGASAEGGASYTLVSPIAGVVTQRQATIGRHVDSEDVVFEIVDPSVVWAELDIPESELALVRAGQIVSITMDGLGETEFKGELSYVAPGIDPHTRTAVGRVSLPNANGALRANFFGRGRIAVSDPRAAVLVPRTAVQRAKSVQLVFVRLAEDTYEARRVSLGETNGELVSVAGRVKAGDEVVTEGSFLLKTETLKESIGAGCCEVD